MVDIIKLKIEKKKNKKRVGPILLLSILFIYFISVATTIAVMLTINNREKLVVENQLLKTEGAFYAVEVTYSNLKVGKKDFVIYAKDFVVEFYNDDEIQALCFEGGAKKLTIKRDQESQTVKVMFPRVNDLIIYGSYDELLYKGEEIEYAEQNIFSKILTICVVETIVFVLVMLFVYAGIEFVSASKKYKNKYKEINESVVKELNARGFKSTKVFYMPSPRTGTTNMEKLVLCIDKNNNKLAFVDYANKECIIANASDVIKYSVIENNGVGMKQTTALTLFDIPYTTTESYNLCNKLQLVIVLDSEEKTNVVYEFVKGGVRQNSDIYNKMSRELIDVTAVLEIMTGGVKKDKVAFVKCKYCGSKNKANDTRCGACGSVLD